MGHLRVAYVTVNDPSDKNTWSGLEYYIAQTVNKYIGDVTYIGNLKNRVTFRHHLKRFYYKLQQEQYLAERTEEMGVYYARQIEEKLQQSEFDLIFSPSTIPIAHLKTDLPIVVWLDATFAVMVDYYFKQLCAESIRDGNLMDNNAFKRCAFVCFASQWAASSAVDDYSIERGKIKVIPFGANFDMIPEKRGNNNSLSIPLQLLFVAKDWCRKGGETVFQTFIALQDMGIETNLFVVGCVPPKKFQHAQMKVFSFLDKNVYSDATQLDWLYRNAHFLILPSKEECYGLVLCEANAYGVPVLASDTGGIPEIVRDGINGFLMPTDASGNDYALKIVQLVRDKTSYIDLCESSRKRFDEVLNWNAGGELLRDVLLKKI